MGSPGGGGAGWRRAWPIGTRMSGGPQWARTLPSSSRTMAWIRDWGWTTTSISSYGRSNRWCASITSRPLFISVAESIVIFSPMVQVGWREGVVAAHPLQFIGGSAAERTPRGGEDRRPHALARHALQELEEGRVLGVDRHQARARAGPDRRDQVAAGDEALLVGERDRDAALQRRQRRAQAGGADQRVQHDVGGAGVDQGGEVRVVGHRAPAGGGGRPPDAVGLGLRRHRVHAAPAGETARLQVGRPVDDLEGLDADRSGASQDEYACHPSSVARPPRRPW